MGSTRRNSTPEYKQDAVALIVDGGHTIGEVAKKLEMNRPGSAGGRGLRSFPGRGAGLKGIQIGGRSQWRIERSNSRSTSARLIDLRPTHSPIYPPD